MNKGVIWVVAGVFALGVWVIAWSALALYLWERNSTPTVNPADYACRFGTVSADDDNPEFLKETAVLPLRYKDSGFRFGVQIVPNDDKPYTYYFVFHLSAVPKVLTGESFERKAPSSTLQTVATKSEGGTSTVGFSFDPGDPTGDQSVDVFINGTLVKTINYTVVPNS
jgi:hypothetical protein